MNFPSVLHQHSHKLPSNSTPSKLSAHIWDNPRCNFNSRIKSNLLDRASYRCRFLHSPCGKLGCSRSKQVSSWVLFRTEISAVASNAFFWVMSSIIELGWVVVNFCFCSSSALSCKWESVVVFLTFSLSPQSTSWIRNANKTQQYINKNSILRCMLSFDSSIYFPTNSPWKRAFGQGLARLPAMSALFDIRG